LFQAPEVTPLSVALAVATAALQPQDHEDAISSAADSVAAAAMMLMTGGCASSPAKNAMNGVECIDSVDQGGNSNEQKELSQRVVTSPVIEAKATKLSTSWQVRSFPLWNAENSPPKEQVKFNLRGTVVQVPTEILLKHEGASDSWKTSDDFENASISVSCCNDSPDSVSSGKKRKDRSGHPKLNQLAVDYLRSWLLSRQHIEHPYPSEQNYADLSRATGVEKPQLKNWFV
jgi:hypothetical protein